MSDNCTFISEAVQICERIGERNCVRKKLVITILKGKYAVCKVDNVASILDFSKNSEFFSITKTADQVSIVCSPDIIHANEFESEKNWKIMKLEGPLDFSLVGILASISTVLAKRDLSIFVISTYDTNYILVKDEDLETAINALSHEGYKIRKI
jgi:hypothetical protein